MDASLRLSVRDQVRQCITCDCVFNRPEVAITELAGKKPVTGTNKLEIIDIDRDDLRNSAGAGCHWCSVQWQSVREAYERIQDPACTFEKIRISVTLMWEQNLRFTGFQIRTHLDGNANGYKLDIALGKEVFPTLDICTTVSLEGVVDTAKSPHDLPESTSSATCLALAKDWWKACEMNHVECQIKSVAWLPNRLLDLEDHPRLITTHGLSKSPAMPYIALSHKWGLNPAIVFKLDSSNITELMHKLPLERLSPVFCDAIDFTRRLGIRYLWIDSLCILQDSDDDWKAEAAFMCKVYSNCTLHIAADPLSSAPSPPSMFQNRTFPELCGVAGYDKTVIRKNFQQRYNFTLARNSGILVHDLRSLNSRAWVFQERLLSPRTLHFSDQLFWECRRQRANETFRAYLPGDYKETQGKTWSLQVRSSDRPGNYLMWEHVLSQYLSCDLTFPSDRLIAISALAEDFASRLRSEYCAGLWRARMPGCLAWHICPTRPGQKFPTRQAKYRCPTWSWASLNITEGIHFWCKGDDLTHLPIPLALVVDIAITSPSGNVYTDITDAKLVLEGWIESVDLSSLGKHGAMFFPWDDSGQRYWLDFGPCSADGVEIYILPVSISKSSHYIYALLLKASSTGDEATFEKIGMARLRQNSCPEELQWICDLRHRDGSLEDLPCRISLV